MRVNIPIQMFTNVMKTTTSQQKIKRKTNPDRIEKMKFCPRCNKQTLHREKRLNEYKEEVRKWLMLPNLRPGNYFIEDNEIYRP